MNKKELRVLNMAKFHEVWTPPRGFGAAAVRMRSVGYLAAVPGHSFAFKITDAGRDALAETVGDPRTPEYGVAF